MKPTDTTRGLLYAFAAHALWGLVPLFWKQLVHVPAPELVAHRVAWSLVFVLGILVWQRRVPELVALLRNRRAVLWTAAATALITVNWGIYIWAVIAGKITQASLGYYITPLLNVLLGRVFFGETLRGMQIASVVLAGAGVAFMAFELHEMPWVGLALAFSFGLYGVLRKQAPALPLPGLAVETLIGAPFAFLFIGWRGVEGTWAFAHSTPLQTALVFGAGALTALPLLWFAHAARRLRYSTLGLIQYLTPTMQLLLAVALYGEPFTRAHGVTFACIWAGVALYATDAVLAQRRLAHATSA